MIAQRVVFARWCAERQLHLWTLAHVLLLRFQRRHESFGAFDDLRRYAGQGGYL